MTETVLVSFLSVRGLECSFHLYLTFLFFAIWSAKLVTFLKLNKQEHIFARNFLQIFPNSINFAPFLKSIQARIKEQQYNTFFERI